ncbi:hypothetical protein ACFOD9_04320 [Novosphingobium bradum]|uniref:Uncharacterized protein n=2 Tax=Novosphingobium bradum TaxID=1737444 RepID=A0ABV7IQF8_9SPHN
MLNELFGSTNFKAGGVGRVDRNRALRAIEESDLINACRSLGYILLIIGTDYIVALAGAEVTKLL